MATTYINNLSDLRSIVGEKIVSKALEATQKVIRRAIQESIDEYYKERVFKGGHSSMPKIYDRTYKLLNSVVSSKVSVQGNSYVCEVGIDENYLNYQYPGTPGFDGIPATGRDILEWNNETGSHGGTVDGDWEIWNQAVQTLSGDYGILTILKDNLRKYGLNVV